MNNNNTITETLKRNFDTCYNDYSSFFRNSENTVSICNGFIRRHFSINSNSITIQARITNPKKKGWKKIETSTFYVRVSGKKTIDIVHHRLWKYLNRINFNTFYLKVSQNIV